MQKPFTLIFCSFLEAETIGPAVKVFKGNKTQKWCDICDQQLAAIRPDPAIKALVWG